MQIKDIYIYRLLVIQKDKEKILNIGKIRMNFLSPPSIAMYV